MAGRSIAARYAAGQGNLLLGFGNIDQIVAGNYVEFDVDIAVFHAVFAAGLCGCTVACRIVGGNNSMHHRYGCGSQHAAGYGGAENTACANRHFFFCAVNGQYDFVTGLIIAAHFAGNHYRAVLLDAVDNIVDGNIVQLNHRCGRNGVYLIATVCLMLSGIAVLIGYAGIRLDVQSAFLISQGGSGQLKRPLVAVDYWGVIFAVYRYAQGGGIAYRRVAQR